MRARLILNRLAAAVIDHVPLWRCAYCRRVRVVHATFGLTFHATGARAVRTVCRACSRTALDEFLAATVLSGAGNKGVNPSPERKHA